jgi:hypothetical protein
VFVVGRKDYKKTRLSQWASRRVPVGIVSLRYVHLSSPFAGLPQVRNIRSSHEIYHTCNARLTLSLVGSCRNQF